MRKRLFSIAALTVVLTGLLVPGLGLAATKKGLAPKLGIDIPFVELTEPQKAGEGAGSYYFIPWLGEYMTGVYQAGVAIASLLSAVMLVIGGVGWATAGGNNDRVTKSKKRITNALVGLFLSLGAYSILYVINPDLVKFRALKIRVVKPEAVELEVLDKDVFQRLAEIGLRSNPQLAGLVCDPSKKREGDGELDCYHGRAGSSPVVKMNKPTVVGDGTPEKDALLPYVYAAGKAWNVDPCLAYATIGSESGWKPGVIGHDEDFDTNPWTVPSRMLHLASDCGISLSIPRDDCKADPTRTECVAFNNAQKGKCMNKLTRHFDPNKDDYGFDWRFSHGVGLGQSTIFQNSRCPDGKRGITYEDRRNGSYGARCYTVPELIDASTSIDALYRELAGIQFAAGSANRPPEQILTLYICSSCEQQAQGRISVYRACKANFQRFMCGVTCTNSSCRTGSGRETCDNYEQMMADWRPPANTEQ